MECKVYFFTGKHALIKELVRGTPAEPASAFTHMALITWPFMGFVLPVVIIFVEFLRDFPEPVQREREEKKINTLTGNILSSCHCYGQHMCHKNNVSGVEHP